MLQLFGFIVDVNIITTTPTIIIRILKPFIYIVTRASRGVGEEGRKKTLS